eukprot:scaffold259926_cov21-Tisochrysis_lutea.AAC.1
MVACQGKPSYTPDYVSTGNRGVCAYVQYKCYLALSYIIPAFETSSFAASLNDHSAWLAPPTMMMLFSPGEGCKGKEARCGGQQTILVLVHKGQGRHTTEMRLNQRPEAPQQATCTCAFHNRQMQCIHAIVRAKAN